MTKKTHPGLRIKVNIVYATSDGQLNLIVDVATKGNHTRSQKQNSKHPKSHLSFSPDGKEIAFAQFRLPEEGDDTDLMIYNLETKQIRRLIDQYAIQMWPVWSPDGSRIGVCQYALFRRVRKAYPGIVDCRSNAEKWSRQLLLDPCILSAACMVSWTGRKLPFHPIRTATTIYGW